MLISTFPFFITAPLQSKYFLMRPNNQAFLKELWWSLFLKHSALHFLILRFRLLFSRSGKALIFFQRPHHSGPFSWTKHILLHLACKAELAGIQSGSVLPPLLSRLAFVIHMNLKKPRKTLLFFWLHLVGIISEEIYKYLLWMPEQMSYFLSLASWYLKSVSSLASEPLLPQRLRSQCELMA